MTKVVQSYILTRANLLKLARPVTCCAATPQVELMEAGRVVGGKGWQNKGYIFPAGFRSRTIFRSSILHGLTGSLRSQTQRTSSDEH